MQCFNPVVGFRRHDNTRIQYTRLSWQAFIVRGNDVYGIPELKNTFYTHQKNVDVTRPLKIPCGKCDACKLNNARDLATRCMMELNTSKGIGIFLTLTYDQENIPADGKYREEDLIGFVKRLRKRIVVKIQTLGVAEYGSRTKRPHYHLLIFGWRPADAQKVRTSDSNHAGESYDIFISNFIDDCWKLGKTEFGSITEQSCAYVARYTYEKNREKNGEKNGEYKPKTLCRSRRPALGAAFVDQFSDSVVVKGSVSLRVGGGGIKDFPLPRYVLRRIREKHSRHVEALDRAKEISDKKRNFFEETKGRVKAKKTVFLQKIDKLKRSL